MTHVYIGDGKGKTSAALGLALRAAGHGSRVYVAQFLKDKDYPSGEIKAIAMHPDLFVIERFPNQIHPMFASGERVDVSKIKKSVTKALHKVGRYLETKKFDVYVLDEILNAISSGFCSERALARVMKMAVRAELVLTGRAASAQIIASSDYVSIIKKCRHPFDRKIAARKSIEY